jgi:two-component system response regulator AlgR
MKILIVDDEKPARDRLHDLIIELDPGHSIMQAENGKTALHKIAEDPPELVLMDIRMPVMDGLEAAYHLAAMHPSPAIVFTTAYQDHALAAFETNAVDYLLKPIRRERLQQAIERAQIISRARLADILANEPAAGSRSCLSATSMGKVALVPIAEIGYLKAEHKYVLAGCGSREILVDESLKSLEAEFPDRFLRIHRNALIAPGCVASLKKDKDGSYTVQLSGYPKAMAVSRRHLADVRRIIRNMGKSKLPA